MVSVMERPAKRQPLTQTAQHSTEKQAAATNVHKQLHERKPNRKCILLHQSSNNTTDKNNVTPFKQCDQHSSQHYEGGHENTYR